MTLTPTPSAESTEKAEAVVDAWDEAEGESMRDGYRQTMERLIALALDATRRDTEREVVEKAARAVCEDCAAGEPLVAVHRGYNHRGQDRGGLSFLYTCEASDLWLAFPLVPAPAAQKEKP